MDFAVSAAGEGELEEDHAASRLVDVEGVDPFRDPSLLEHGRGLLVVAGRDEGSAGLLPVARQVGVVGDVTGQLLEEHDRVARLALGHSCGPLHVLDDRQRGPGVRRVVDEHPRREAQPLASADGDGSGHVRLAEAEEGERLVFPGRHRVADEAHDGAVAERRVVVRPSGHEVDRQRRIDDGVGRQQPALAQHGFGRSGVEHPPRPAAAHRAAGSSASSTTRAAWMSEAIRTPSL